ncbi:MAG: hypothetical protein ACXABY_05560 [Candidatus Thorarchaeota archaeon]|jgi:hypothetical protein
MKQPKQPLNEAIAALSANTAARLMHSGVSKDEAVKLAFEKTGVVPDSELLWALTQNHGTGKSPTEPGHHWIKQGFFNAPPLKAEDVDNTLDDEHNSIYTLDGANSPSDTMENKRLVATMSDDNRLDILQDAVKDALGDKSKFGNPVSVSLPSGESIVYRRRQYEGRPDPVSYELTRSEARRAQPKRSKAQVEAWNKLSAPRRRSIVDSSADPKRIKLMASDDSYELNLMEQFPFAYELVEYVQGGGTASNLTRMLQLKPPVIHGIEDIADSVDWHLLSKGINSEHIETALNKDGTNVLLFMDDRAKPQLPQIKEILNKFGEPRILQKADDIAENTGQPHGFYVFELTPDDGMYEPREVKQPEAGDWDRDTEKRGANHNESLDISMVESLFAESLEPFCSTCGDQLFEADPRSAFKPSTKMADRKFQQGQRIKKSTSAWKLKDFSASQEDEDYDFTETDDQGEMKAKVEFGKKAKKLDKQGRVSTSGTGTTYNMDSLEDDGSDLDESLRRKLKTLAKRKIGRVGRQNVKAWKAAAKGDHKTLGRLMGTATTLRGADKQVRRAKRIATMPYIAAKKVHKVASEVKKQAGRALPDMKKMTKTARKVHSKSLKTAKALSKKLPSQRSYNPFESLECQNCGTAATPLDEHEFHGYYCARHGNRLDKYSRACNECQTGSDTCTIACPDCHSKTTMEDTSCGVCGTVFMEDEVTDYAGYMADNMFPYEEDDEIVEMDHNWDDDELDEKIDPNKAAQRLRNAKLGLNRNATEAIAKGAKKAGSTAKALADRYPGFKVTSSLDDEGPNLAETLADTLFADVEEDHPFV